MEIGESVSCIAAFNGVSSECSFGCPSGTYGVFNSEANKIVFSKKTRRTNFRNNNGQRIKFNVFRRQNMHVSI